MKSCAHLLSVYRNSSCSFRIDEIIYSSPFFASSSFVEKDTGRSKYLCKCLYWWKCIFAYLFKESHIHINELLEYLLFFFASIQTRLYQTFVEAGDTTAKLTLVICKYSHILC